MENTSGFHLARSADGGNKTPVLIALTSVRGEQEARGVLDGTEIGAQFELHRVLERDALVDMLRVEPTVAVLVDELKHLPTVSELKSEETFRDVPVIYFLPEFDPRSMRKAAEAGCDDVVVLGSDGAELRFRLDAIWAYHREYGFAPPSGHWYVFTDAVDAPRQTDTPTGEFIAVNVTQRFASAPEADQAAHVLLISDHPFYKIRGQDLLTRAGYNVSFVDSGFAAMRFLFDLARHQAPNTPEVLQGKLDLILIALASSNAQSTQLVRRIKNENDYAEVPILLVTDSADELELLRPYMSRGVYTTVGDEPQAEDMAFQIYEIFEGATYGGTQGKRYLYSGPCTYRSASDAPGHWHHGMMYNVGRRGIYIRTIAPPIPGEEVHINFRLRQDSFLLEFAGPVIWSNKWRPASRQQYPAGFGVALQEGTPSHFEALVDFCDLLRESEVTRPRPQNDK